MYEIKISKTGRFCVGRITRWGWQHHCHYLTRERAEACVAYMDAWLQHHAGLGAVITSNENTHC